MLLAACVKRYLSARRWGDRRRPILSHLISSGYWRIARLCIADAFVALMLFDASAAPEAQSDRFIFVG